MQRKVNKLGLGALAFGHMTVDMQTSSLAVLIPILHSSFALDYAAAALIITLNSITSSLIQPIFGLVSDRKPLRWLLPLGCIVTSVGMILVIFMPSYWLVLLAVIASGLGSAAYHPEGSRNANYVSGDNKASGLSVFFVGGNIGYAIGPIATTLLIGFFGTPGIIGMIIPGLIGMSLLWYLQPLYAKAAQNQQIRKRTSSNAQPVRTKRQVAGAMSILLSIISIRSMLQTGLVTFIPLYFISLSPSNKDYAAFLLAVFLLCGAVGTLFGGAVADKFGRKTVMASSLIVVTPLLFVFLNTSGVIQVVTLGVAGAALIAASSLTVVMAQETLPNSIGLASGLTLGLGFGAGGLGAAALGKVADWTGLPQTMFILALLPIPVVILSLMMPNTRQPKATIEPVETATLQPELTQKPVTA